jgi:dihydrofolate synthase/folylpolyglutamate synthase
VVGALGSARAKALLETAAHHAAELHLVVPGQPRAMSWEQLEQLIPAGFRGRVHRATVKELFPEPGECVAGSPGDTVIVTGSVYLIGEVLERLEPQRGTGEGRLQDF